MPARRSAMNLYRAAEFLLGVMFPTGQSGTVMFNQPGTDFDVRPAALEIRDHVRWTLAGLSDCIKREATGEQ